MPATADLAAIACPLLEFASIRFDDGQRQLAHSIKLKVGSSGNRAAELLDYSQDAPFLSPALFAFFSQSNPAAPLDQILCDILPADKRPVRIEGSAIEYSVRPNPLFEPICQRVCSGGALGGVTEAVDYSEVIAQALKIIQSVDAELHRSILAATRQIVTFTGENGESFATLAAHGAVFLRTPQFCDEVFFVEDLVHQCGHLLFNAATLDRGELIEIPSDTPLRELTGDATEKRSLYVALHGVFTECLMSIVLAGALRLDCFDMRQRHELQGRLSLIMKRLHLDLGSLWDLDVFTASGRDLLGSFGEVSDCVYRSAKDAIVDCDLRNQPYSFCNERFAELNPSG